MDRIEKVKEYLKICGYSEERIEKLITDPKYCNAIYNRIVAYELLNPIQTYEKLKVGRKK